MSQVNKSINGFMIYSFWVQFDVLSVQPKISPIGLDRQHNVFQLVCSFSIRLRTRLGLSINTSYLYVSQSEHVI
ncbi:Tryptophan--tRNA ligase [Gossypium arboreum]|uniref:Tryptophan--tRNA ligase n=1 Tax=Gossypium arboreum TaxID=29729 RepID=A0A0B0MHS2_GOSAR|nr:Tryptophan--tRNA ligase [Gossypium arboreum]